MRLQLSNPLTQEDIDLITDANMERTTKVWFHTPNGNEVEFVKVVRCKDCRWHENEQPSMVYCPAVVGGWVDNDWFCKGGERRDDV